MFIRPIARAPWRRRCTLRASSSLCAQSMVEEASDHVRCGRIRVRRRRLSRNSVRPICDGDLRIAFHELSADHANSALLQLHDERLTCGGGWSAGLLDVGHRAIDEADGRAVRGWRGLCSQQQSAGVRGHWSTRTTQDAVSAFPARQAHAKIIIIPDPPRRSSPHGLVRVAARSKTGPPRESGITASSNMCKGRTNHNNWGREIAEIRGSEIHWPAIGLQYQTVTPDVRDHDAVSRASTCAI